MKLLFVMPDLPYPAKNGGKIRNYSILKFLSFTNDIYLIAFDRQSEDKTRVSALKEICKEVIAVPLAPWQEASAKRKEQLKSLVSTKSYQYLSHYSPEMQKAIDALLERVSIDLIQVESAQMGYYRLPESIPSVLDQHNVEYEILYRSYKSSAVSLRKLFNFLEWRKFQRDEIKNCNRYTAVLTCSQRDKDIHKEQGVTSRLEVVPNGSDTEYYQPLRTDVREAEMLLFTGTISYFPNTDALPYFIDEILPLVHKERPNVKLVIAGRDPPLHIQAYAKDARIIITGFVDDIRTYFDEATLAVVPLRVGGGTRLKIIEAWSMGLPLVATSIGAEGLDYTEEKDILIANTPQAFADSILKLLTDKELWQTLAKNGRTIATQHYDWRSIAQKLERIYRDLVKS